jgi:hypothetical protein
MIAKITTGAGFRGTLDYLMNQKSEKGRGGSKAAQRESSRAASEGGPAYGRGERHRIIGSNMSGRTPRELATEFGAIRRQRPSISKPVHHVSLSAASGERLTVEQWQGIAARYVEGMGFREAPYVIVQHRDTESDHVHILTSRVDVRGLVVKDSYEKRRAEEIMRAVEREYGLTPVASSREVDRAAPKRGETEEFSRTGRLSAKMSMQGKVERALKGKPTGTEFIGRLGKTGVEVLPHIQSTGRVSGVSFRQGGELMKGSDLGRGFSWGGLQKRGLDYDAERDREAVEDAWKRANPDRIDELPTPPPAPTTNRALGTLQELGDSVGQYLMDQANPIKRIEGQVRSVERLGEGLTDGYQAARELLRPKGIEGLQQAAGIEGYRDESEAVERLNSAAGGTPPSPALKDAVGPSAADVAEAGADAPAAGQTAVVEVEEMEEVSILEFLM